jgi:hypothetical protein
MECQKTEINTKSSAFFASMVNNPQYGQINPLPVQFKSLLPGQEGCVVFSGNLNLRTYQCVLVRLGRQVAFKSSTL